MDGAVESGERAAYEVAQELQEEELISTKIHLVDPTLPDKEHATVSCVCVRVCACVLVCIRRVCAILYLLL
jgi:hypothetical protein